MKFQKKLIAIFICVLCTSVVKFVETTILATLLGQNQPGFSNFDNNLNNLGNFANLGRRRCPLCDSSVYSYCSDKLFHDSCCCHNPNNPYDRLPYECQYADCSFIHANTCQEHKLITACCCINRVY
ncbi:uncharacterized protein [Onthophagus taurus]|uniref:uncharacterized protein n=1 Tax=Onthophagus taurus TaxID=166361 RepID=UPI000C1FF035|nr:uncharacterized protein LOC111422848 [Onthophagus taurus]